jgi:hypothetical protein
METETKKKKITIESIVIFFLVGILLFLLYIYFYTKKSHVRPSVPLPPSYPTAVQSPIPLPTGKQIFNSTYGDSDQTKPKIGYIAVDPLNSIVGTPQKLTFSIVSPSPVTQVEVVLLTDSKKTILTPRLINGTSTNNEWEASWIQSDTTDRIYSFQFRIGNTQAVRDDDIVFR